MNYEDYEQTLQEKIDFLNRSFLLNISWKMKGRYDAYLFFLNTLKKSGTDYYLFIDSNLNEISNTKLLIPLSVFKNTPDKILGLKNSNTKYLKSKINTLFNLLIDYHDVFSKIFINIK